MQTIDLADLGDRCNGAYRLLEKHGFRSVVKPDKPVNLDDVSGAELLVDKAFCVELTLKDGTKVWCDTERCDEVGN